MHGRPIFLLSFAAIGLVVAFTAASCTPEAAAPAAGPTADAVDATAGATVALDDLRSAFIAARCSAYDVCQPSPQWFASPAACQGWFASGYPFGSEPKWAKQGKMAYHADKAALCVAAAGQCPATVGSPKICSEVFTPVLEDGAKCTHSAMCTSNFCSLSGDLVPLSCGECAQLDRAPLGGFCKSFSCAEGGACAGWPSPKCVPVGSGGPGDACGDDSCANPLYCDTFSNVASPVCTALGKLGEPCTRNIQCSVGLVCDAMPGQGGKCASPRSEGDPCHRYAVPGYVSGAGDDCGGALICGVIGPWDGTGSPDARCVSRRKLGQSCASHWQCGMLDAVCLGGTCSTWPALGGACVQIGAQRYCGPKASCDNGICVAIADLGQPCKDSCLPGLACRSSGASGAKSCVLFGQPGAPCKDDMECGGTLLCGSSGCYEGPCM